MTEHESEVYERLEQEEERQRLSRRTKIVAAFAVLLAIAAIAMIVQVVTRNTQKVTKNYTIDSSPYGVPDGCGDYTAICSEDLESGAVECLCGSYLYKYQNGEWIQA
jgi:uncharacterized membrane protein